MTRLSLGLALSLALAAPSAPAAAPSGPGWQLDWARGAVFYEVFVRSFADADGDGKGDLRGLVSRLDYLNDGDPTTTADLGVDALWLMPIFPSASYHGYDATDYYGVDPDYGTAADLDLLVREAHRRGMRVILDLALNQTSDQHPWFLESARGPTSPRRDWYSWRGEDPGWTQPWSSNPTWFRRGEGWYYGLFYSGMPDLNFRNPAVREEARRIVRHWLDRGVDGFRLDAVKYLVETPDGGQVDADDTHAFLRELSAYVRAVRPDAVLVGEVWSNPADVAPYYGDTAAVAGGDELPMNFDFAIGGAVISAVRTGAAVNVVATLRELAGALPKGVIDCPFLGNHDQMRLATALDGDPGRLRAAAAVLLTLPGAPFVYYGEEIGMRNEGPGFGDRTGPAEADEGKRTPMAWDGTPGAGFTRGEPWRPLSGGHDRLNVRAELNDPSSLLARYRSLIALRHRSAALRQGGVELLPPRGSVLAYLRATAGERVLVVHNVGATAATSAPLAVPEASLEPLFLDPGVGAPARAAGGLTVELPPYATAVWRLAPAPAARP